jgi:hypothetical protein
MPVFSGAAGVIPVSACVASIAFDKIKDSINYHLTKYMKF